MTSKYKIEPTKADSFGNVDAWRVHHVDNYWHAILAYGGRGNAQRVADIFNSMTLAEFVEFCFVSLIEGHKDSDINIGFICGRDSVDLSRYYCTLPTGSEVYGVLGADGWELCLWAPDPIMNFGRYSESVYQRPGEQIYETVNRLLQGETHDIEENV